MCTAFAGIFPFAFHKSSCTNCKAGVFDKFLKLKSSLLLSLLGWLSEIEAVAGVDSELREVGLVFFCLRLCSAPEGGQSSIFQDALDSFMVSPTLRVPLCF